MSKITDRLKIDAEIISITSAAGATSQNYDMQKYGQAAFVVSVYGDLTGGITLDLMESSAATAAGSSAAGGKAGIVIGGTAATNIASGSGVREITLTMGTASTTGQYFTLSAGTVTKKFTYTTSTAAWASGSTLQSATNLYFGSTVGSTVDTGLQLSLDSLKTQIESTLGFSGSLICSTLSTVTLQVRCADSAAGSIGLSASAVMTAAVNQAAGVFNLQADQMTSTASKRYLSVKVSTASTTCRVAVDVIRDGGRYMPADDYKYKLSS